MSFKLVFAGGPLNGTSEMVKGAPQVLRLEAERAKGMLGHYMLRNLKQGVARMEWRPETEEVTKNG